jgi:hypothetical protein
MQPHLKAEKKDDALDFSEGFFPLSFASDLGPVSAEWGGTVEVGPGAEPGAVGRPYGGPLLLVPGTSGTEIPSLRHPGSASR